jgi:hypothetical protein
MNQTPLSRVFNAPFCYQDCWRYVRSLHSMNTKTINYLYQLVMNIGEVNTMYVRDVVSSTLKFVKSFDLDIMHNPDGIMREGQHVLYTTRNCPAKRRLRGRKS